MKTACSFRGRCVAFSVAVIFPAVIALAGPRASTHYVVDAEIFDAGGRRASSAQYAHSGSIGSIAGVSSAGAPGVIAKHGFLGQIADVIGLQITATSTTVNEGGTLQLFAAKVLDDATTARVSPNLVTWGVVSGPLVSIASGGVPNAGTVFEDTPATIGGTFLGHAATLGLTVLNVGSDDFGSYAGDALNDAWQVEYFGLENPSAAPGLDPDGDGLSNAFEFAAGVAPTDASSRFQLRIESVPGQPSQRNVVFSPRLVDRSYEIEFRTEFALDSWAPLTSSSHSDNGAERIVTDLDAGGSAKFYRVLITKP